MSLDNGGRVLNHCYNQSVIETIACDTNFDSISRVDIVFATYVCVVCTRKSSIDELQKIHKGLTASLSFVEKFATSFRLIQSVYYM